jgi:hypothetical protein
MRAALVVNVIQNRPVQVTAAATAAGRLNSANY